MNNSVIQLLTFFFSSYEEIPSYLLAEGLEFALAPHTTVGGWMTPFLLGRISANTEVVSGSTTGFGLFTTNQEGIYWLK